MPITVAGKEQMKHEVLLHLSLFRVLSLSPPSPTPLHSLTPSLAHFLRIAFELANLKT